MITNLNYKIDSVNKVIYIELNKLDKCRYTIKELVLSLTSRQMYDYLDYEIKGISFKEFKENN
jgi:hypothetical protein